VPAGATRVNLAGKTVMPMLIDTHTHLSTTRDKLVLDLRQRAYFGVGAALSLGTDNYELLDLRNKDNPGMARFLSAGKGISRTEGRPTLEINSVEEARKASRQTRRTRSTSSRSGSRTATARSTRSFPLSMKPSLTRLTRMACASPRTSSTRLTEAAHSRRARRVRAQRARQGHRR